MCGERARARAHTSRLGDERLQRLGGLARTRAGTSVAATGRHTGRQRCRSLASWRQEADSDHGQSHARGGRKGAARYAHSKGRVLKEILT